MAYTGLLGDLERLREGTGCPLDDLLYAIANDRRRRLLATLADGPAERSLADVAQRLATDEPDRHGSRGEHYRRLYLDLYHAHVPELVDAGLIEYQPDGGTVRLTGAGIELTRGARTVGERT